MVRLAFATLFIIGLIQFNLNITGHRKMNSQSITSVRDHIGKINTSTREFLYCGIDIITKKRGLMHAERFTHHPSST